MTIHYGDYEIIKKRLRTSPHDLVSLFSTQTHRLTFVNFLNLFLNQILVRSTKRFAEFLHQIVFVHRQTKYWVRVLFHRLRPMQDQM
jgi:hypothetical protein